jgi:hypothetical protein
VPQVHTTTLDLYCAHLYCAYIDMTFCNGIV